VDGIAALSRVHQQLLAQAAIANLHSIPLALERLEALGENATIDLLLQQNRNRHAGPSAQARDIETLVDVMSECFPGMPSITAQSLGESVVMAEVVDVVRALREALYSNNLKSDFVVTTLYAVVKLGKRMLEDQISARPSLVQVIRKSGLTWDGDDEA